MGSFHPDMGSFHRERIYVLNKQVILVVAVAVASWKHAVHAQIATVSPSCVPDSPNTVEGICVRSSCCFFSTPLRLACSTTCCGVDCSPTLAPTVTNPTKAPSLPPTSTPINSPSYQPTSHPSRFPTLSSPTQVPSSSVPTSTPTTSPTLSTPSQFPTLVPSNYPTTAPLSGNPTRLPSLKPTGSAPTLSPFSRPSSTPTMSPSDWPTLSPTRQTCNGVADPALCFDPTSECVGVILSLCPVVCGTCDARSSSAPPTISYIYRSGSPSALTASPNRSPVSLLPSSVPSSSPYMSPSTWPSTRRSTAPTTAVPTDTPTFAFPTASPTTNEPTTRGPTAVPVSNRCDGLIQDPLVCTSTMPDCLSDIERFTCPITCGLCSPTAAPTSSPVDATCNGALDPQLCSEIGQQNCVNSATVCPVRCNACPPTRAPTGAPSETPTESTTRTSTATSTVTTSARSIDTVRVSLLSTSASSSPVGLARIQPFLVYSEGTATIGIGETSSAAIIVEVLYSDGSTNSITESPLLNISYSEASRFPPAQLLELRREATKPFEIVTGTSGLDGWVTFQIEALLPGHPPVETVLNVSVTSLDDIVSHLTLWGCTTTDNQVPGLEGPVRRIAGTDPATYQTVQVHVSAIMLTSGDIIYLDPSNDSQTRMVNFEVLGNASDWSVNGAQRSIQPLRDSATSIHVSYSGFRARAPITLTAPSDAVVEVSEIETMQIRAHREGCPVLDSSNGTFYGLPGESGDIVLFTRMNDGTICRTRSSLFVPSQPACDPYAPTVVLPGVFVFESTVPSALAVDSNSGTLTLLQNHVTLVTVVATAPDLGSHIRSSSTVFCNIDPVAIGDWDFGDREGLPLTNRRTGEEFDVEFRGRVDNSTVAGFKLNIVFDDDVITLAGPASDRAGAVANRGDFESVTVAIEANSATVTAVFSPSNQQNLAGSITMTLTFIAIGSRGTSTTISGTMVELVDSRLLHVVPIDRSFEAGYAIQRIVGGRIRKGHRNPTTSQPFLDSLPCTDSFTTEAAGELDPTSIIMNHPGFDSCIGAEYTPSAVGWCGSMTGCSNSLQSSRYPPADFNLDCCLSVLDLVAISKFKAVIGRVRPYSTSDCFDVAVALSISNYSQKPGQTEQWRSAFDMNGNDVMLDAEDVSSVAAVIGGIIPVLDRIEIYPVDLSSNCQMQLSVDITSPLSMVSSENIQVLFRLSKASFNGYPPQIGPGVVGHRLESHHQHCGEAIIATSNLNDSTRTISANFTTNFSSDVVVVADIAVWPTSYASVQSSIYDLHFPESPFSLCRRSNGVCAKLFRNVAFGVTAGNYQSSTECWPPCSDREFEVAPATPFSPPQCEYLTTSQTSTATSTATTTASPTASPSTFPSEHPTSTSPTYAPSFISDSPVSTTPTQSPSLVPTYSSPTSWPSGIPSLFPFEVSQQPSQSPIKQPSTLPIHSSTGDTPMWTSEMSSNPMTTVDGWIASTIVDSSTVSAPAETSRAIVSMSTTEPQTQVFNVTPTPVLTPSEPSTFSRNGTADASSSENHQDVSIAIIAIAGIAIFALCTYFSWFIMFQRKNTNVYNVNETADESDQPVTQVVHNEVFTPSYKLPEMIHVADPADESKIDVSTFHIEIENLDSYPKSEHVPQLESDAASHDAFVDILPGVAADGRVYITASKDTQIRYCVDDLHAVPYVDYAAFPLRLSLTAPRTVEVRAQAFANGQPVSTVISKKFTLQQVHSPRIAVLSKHDDVNNCAVSIKSTTVGATLLYRIVGMNTGLKTKTVHIKSRSDDFQVVIPKGSQEELGIAISEPNSDGFFITQLSPSGLCKQTGKIQPGMKLTSINGVSIAGISKDKCLSLLKWPADRVTLGLKHRSYEFDEYDEDMASGGEHQFSSQDGDQQAEWLEYNTVIPEVVADPKMPVTIEAMAVMDGWVPSSITKIVHTVKPAHFAERTKSLKYPVVSPPQTLIELQTPRIERAFWAESSNQIALTLCTDSIDDTIVYSLFSANSHAEEAYECRSQSTIHVRHSRDLVLQCYSIRSGFTPSEMVFFEFEVRGPGWYRDVPSTKAEAYEILQNQANFDEGTFFLHPHFESIASREIFCLNVNFRGRKGLRPTRHKVERNKDGMFEINGSIFGMHRTVEQLVRALSTRPLPPKWPVQLQRAAFFNESESRTKFVIAHPYNPAEVSVDNYEIEESENTDDDSDIVTETDSSKLFALIIKAIDEWSDLNPEHNRDNSYLVNLVRSVPSIVLTHYDDHGTALRYAVSEGKVGATALLCYCGALGKRCSRKNELLLHHFVEIEGFSRELVSAMVEVLIDAGLDINERDRNGKTPLDISIDAGLEQAQSVLLEFHALSGSSLTTYADSDDSEDDADTDDDSDISSDHDEYTLFGMMIRAIDSWTDDDPEHSTHNSHLADLLKSMDTGMLVFDGGHGTALKYAVGKGKVGAAAAFCYSGALSNHIKKNNEFLLHHFAQINQFSSKTVEAMLNVLVDAGLYINEKDRYGRSPLDAAEDAGNDVCKDALLKLHAVSRRPDMRDDIATEPISRDTLAPAAGPMTADNEFDDDEGAVIEQILQLRRQSLTSAANSELPIPEFTVDGWSKVQIHGKGHALGIGVANNGPGSQVYIESVQPGSAADGILDQFLNYSLMTVDDKDVSHLDLDEVRKILGVFGAVELNLRRNAQDMHTDITRISRWAFHVDLNNKDEVKAWAIDYLSTRLDGSFAEADNGKFIVRAHDGSRGIYHMALVYKQRLTIHNVRIDPNGQDTQIGKKSYGNFKSLDDLIGALSREPMPPGWPVRLTYGIDPNTNGLVAAHQVYTRSDHPTIHIEVMESLSISVAKCYTQPVDNRIYITSIPPTVTAAVANDLKVGMEIVSVNDVLGSTLTVTEMEGLLSNSSKLVLAVRENPLGFRAMIASKRRRRSRKELIEGETRIDSL